MREAREVSRQQPPQQQQEQLEQRRRATGSNVEPVGAQQQSKSNKLPSSTVRQQTSSSQQQVNRPSIPQPGTFGPLPADPLARAEYYKNVATFAQQQVVDLMFQQNQQMGSEMQLQLQGAVGGQPTGRQQPIPMNG